MIENPAHAEQLYELEKRLKKSRRRTRTLTGTVMVLIIIIGLLSAYLIMSEVSQPLFGKWPAVLEERDELRDEKQALLDSRDSLVQVNRILLENSDTTSGLYYEVQIGAFREFDLGAYRDELRGLGVEYVGDVTKYTLGRFSTFQRALQFRSDIIRLGIDNAFIVAHLNGELIDVREARRLERQNR